MMTSLIPLAYRWLALAVLLAAGIAFGWVKGADHATAQAHTLDAAREAAQLAQVQRAAQKTVNLMQDALTLEDVKNAEIKRINLRLVAATDRLRDRPERSPNLPPASVSGVGVSGTGLARADAEFLGRYAADAAKLRVAVEQCQARYNAAVKAVNEP